MEILTLRYILLTLYCAIMSSYSAWIDESTGRYVVKLSANMASAD